MNRKIAIFLSLMVIFLTAISSYYLFRSEAPENVVKKYLSATKWEDRLQYIRDPDLVREKMRKHYEEGNWAGPVKFIEIKQPIYSKGQHGEWASVDVVMAKGENAFGAHIEKKFYYALRKQSDGYKIDWECSIGYNPLTLVAYKVQMPKESLKYRLIAKLSEFYYGEFSQRKNEYFSINLIEDKSRDSIVGYIKRESEDGKKIFNDLKNGEEIAVMVDIKFIPNSNIPSVMIERYIQRGWNEK